MGLDFSGIDNIEFYSGHYLTAVLEGDLKAVFQRWTEAEKNDGVRPPHKQLASLASRYFDARGKAAGEADISRRLELAMGFHAHLLEALGYERAPDVEPLDGDEVVPVHLSLRRDGNPFLWVLDAPFPSDENEDPLAQCPLHSQLPESQKTADLPRGELGGTATWREILDGPLFRIPRPPSWVLFLAGSEALLIQRQKWPEGRYLRFDLGELFGRKETEALRAMAGLLHRDVLAPTEGVPLHDTLDENSHKHAYAVSGDLKHGVRRGVELLANEAIWYRVEVQKQAVYSNEEFAAKVTADSLQWMYRLLFLFYVEARGAELGVVPMKSDAYRKGYSLEALRDLELVPLTTDKARNGYYIHDSLRKLFSLVNDGFPSEDQHALGFDDSYHDTMELPALRSPLFDDDRLRILKGVRFRNHVLQEILQLLSLSAEKRNRTRGRISYAQLGINQLGAVYEGLLSYTGFFATEDLYEVAAEEACAALSGKPAAEREALKTYFVPASRIKEYREGEIVKDENERRVLHKKGAFIFRLAGRNREKSASYYTPEVLTKCLVKYALKELLWEHGKGREKPRRKKTADEILALTICEPAMGSSAFLIEAVDQMADAYLEARQEERGETIAPEAYQREKRRVKARLATNNCYGVDLNPTAVELAKVSLWLATLYEGGKCPWFGLRLATGNSLVGARREVFKTADVTRKGTKDDPNWLGLVPEPVSLHHSSGGDARPEVSGPLASTVVEDWEHWTAPARPAGTIYHFLLPAEGMVAFDQNKVIKQLAPESVQHIKEWRKECCKPFSKKDAQRLEQLSDAVDRLFAQVVRERVLATHETSDRIPVWGEPASANQAALLVSDQEEVAAALEHQSSAHRRLMFAMDAWCSLWFWPIKEARLLPDRATWLAQLELILEGQVSYAPAYEQQSLFADLAPNAQGQLALQERLPGENQAPSAASAERLKRLQTLSDALRERRGDYFEECGLADIDAVIDGDASLRVARIIADRLRFHHWPLRFVEVFARAGGFDLVLGNPPWIKIEFDEIRLVSDAEPRLDIRHTNASQISQRIHELLHDPGLREAYLEEFVHTLGTQSFLGAAVNYRILGGVQPNLYKCFSARSFEIGTPSGVASFLHPEGMYDDPFGGMLRSTLYQRLAFHFQFVNELRLFSEVDHHMKFSVNIYHCQPTTEIRFEHASNLFHPSTIDGSYSHDGCGVTPGVKDDDDNWDIRPHSHRIVHLDSDSLGLFATLYDTDGTPAEEARLPVLHSSEIVAVLSRFASTERLSESAGRRFYISEFLHENRRQTDGTIRRETRFPEDSSEMIVQGPHFYVGSPFNKTPNEGCRHNLDYTSLDLVALPEEYLPRTNYVPASNRQVYLERTPSWEGRPVAEFYRHVHRQMVSPTGERTLVPAIMPPGTGHVHSVYGLAFEDLGDLVDFSAAASSLPVDFFAKTMGRGSIGKAEVNRLPSGFPRVQELRLRTILLQAITNHYAHLWHATFRDWFKQDKWTSGDRRLVGFFGLEEMWRPMFTLRRDFERRQALLEIDTLVAQSLGLILEELLAIYRIQFPVLQQYERELLYDQQGRIVPASKTAAGIPAVSLVELAVILRDQAGFDVHAEYHPDGSNTQELREQKIRLGKKEADVLGVSERCTMADLLAETEVRWSDEDHPEGRPVHLVGLRYTDPGLEPRMERVYPTPWTRCDREADYLQAWAEFERRLGKRMAGGTPL